MLGTVEEQIAREALGDELYSRILYKPLEDWTMLELAELAGRLHYIRPYSIILCIMKRSIILVLALILAAGLSGSVWLFAQAGPGSGGGTVMYVAVKAAEIKDSTGFFSKTLAVLNPGDTVTVLRVQGKWMEVRSAGNPPLTGWMAAASLSSKRVTSSGRSVSGGELALAGKGFSAEVETVYRQGETLDYTAIDRMEAPKIPSDELSRFLNEGRLARGD